MLNRALTIFPLSLCFENKFVECFHFLGVVLSYFLWLCCLILKETIKILEWKRIDD